MGKYVQRGNIIYWITDKGKKHPVSILAPSQDDTFGAAVKTAASRLKSGNPLTTRAKQWKKDQNIKSLTLEELKKETKGKDLIIEQKIDGQTALLKYDDGKARFGSLGGRIISDIPVLHEIEKILKKENITHAIMVGELAGIENDKIIKFRETQHLIKNEDADKSKLNWFPYSLLELNDEKFDINFNTYTNKSWPKLKDIFKKADRIHPVEDFKDVDKAWKKIVKEQDNEGIVVRTSDNKVYKVKPVYNYDLAVIAVGDKKKAAWPKKRIGNALLAFMDKDKNFRVAGEVGTGWTDKQREDLYKWAQKNKVDEDDHYVWVKPKKIIEVKWERSNIMENKAYKYEDGKYKEIGKKPVGTIVKPVFIRYREDKEVNPEDLRLTQIPNWEDRKKDARINLSKCTSASRISMDFLKSAVEYAFYKESFMKLIISPIRNSVGYSNRQAAYPDHPDEIVISKTENILDNAKPIDELLVWSYYDGIKNKLIPQLKGRDLFVVIKVDSKTIYRRHPYDKETEFIRISNEKDFNEYNSGRTVEYHVTQNSKAEYYAVDFDPAEDFSFDKTKKIVGEIADVLKNISEVNKVEIRYTGKRGFHILGHLKKEKDINQARKDLRKILKDAFGDRDDLIQAESRTKTKGALGEAPMKLNGGNVALHSLRVSGLCCMEVERNKLDTFKREEATPWKVYKRLLDKELKPVAKKASYDQSELKPGYKGKFVIQQHWATNYHWDLRIEFPVKDASKALKNYSDHRPEDSPLPKADDRKNTVYRSWAVPKHKIPTKDDKIFIIPTEDHPIEYGSFKGEIPEGQYGAGTVKIYDKGTYKLIKKEDNKEYIFDFNGDKLKGTYALVKFKNGFLWIKSGEKEKAASVIDYPRPTLSPQIWGIDKTLPHLRVNIRKDILLTVVNSAEEYQLTRPLRWIKQLIISGSIATYCYEEDSDVDVDIIVDYAMVRLLYPELSALSEDDLFFYLREILQKKNKTPVGATTVTLDGKAVGGTSHTYSFMLLRAGDTPSGDGLYDVLHDTWIKIPPKIPESFDPDEVFKSEKQIAANIMSQVDDILLQIAITMKDIKRIDLYEKTHETIDNKRVVALYRLKILCEAMDQMQSAIRDLQKNAKYDDVHFYPAFDFSVNWDKRMIVFKYINQLGYQKPLRILYEKFKNDPYKDLIDRFIPN